MTFANRAAQLDTLLLDHQCYWRFNVYRGEKPSHLKVHSALQAFLLALSDEQVHVLQGDDKQLLPCLAPYFPPAKTILELIETHTASTAAPRQEPPTGVPGRKWQQITAFIQAHTPMTRPVLEWCSGKGYLSAAINQAYSLPTTGLEIDSQLVAAGNARAKQTHAHYKIVPCDVLSDTAHQHVTANQHLIALHACGGLHQRMLSLAVVQRSSQISLAPCCYHRFTDEYVCLSSQCKSSALQFSTDDLRSAVRQTNTARRGETLARRTLQAWHLAFRELLRQQGLPSNTPLPSLGQHWSKRSFTEFCQQLIALKQFAIRLPAQLDDVEESGWRILRRAERIDLIRMAFRRAIELRCVLDSLLFLEEHGYQCSLTTFCAPQLSPRNLLIQACKPAAD